MLRLPSQRHKCQPVGSRGSLMSNVSIFQDFKQFASVLMSNIEIARKIKYHERSASSTHQATDDLLGDNRLP